VTFALNMISSILILNWNGWRDTLECLESVFRLSFPDFRVIICDNSSTDGSLEKIKAWARGEHAAQAASPQLAHLIACPTPKPVPYLELTREQAESPAARHNARLILIQNGANLGFAGGNNVGLRYALGDPECQFFWMLNNDTVVIPDALSALVTSMEEHREVGICGSLTLSYSNPDEVQAQGGMRYNHWTGRVAARARLKLDCLGSAQPSMDYVNGASMIVGRAFLQQIGLMDESYFLYFEELDWAMRAKRRFALGYACNSVVYHKEGAAIGSHTDRRTRSLLSEQCLTRNRVRLTRRYFPWALPTVLAAVCLAALERMCCGDWRRGRMMLSAMMDELRRKTAPDLPNEAPSPSQRSCGVPEQHDVR
jgi:GT2 family glycosyltransferase